MTAKDAYMSLLKRLPGIKQPIKKLTFAEKIKWTGIILIIYYLMSQVVVWGIDNTAVQHIQYLEILLGSSFGSLVTLGIGPIVTASIILQLLVGSKLLGWDLKTEEGKAMFQGTQKLMAILLSIIEAAIYVAFRAIPAQSAGAMPIVVAQLALGGVMVLFMDEVVSKYGFGSGIGIFIVAGVAKTIFIRAFNPLTNAGGLPTATNPPAGIIPYIATSIGSGEMLNAFIAFLPIIATLIVFFLVIYIQAIRVEIPLAFGSIRGFGRRWPLKFLYTSNIPVILIAAMLANVQLMARAVNNPWFGTFDSNGNATGGIMLYLIPPNNQAIIGLAISVGFFALMGAIILYFLKKNDPKIVVGMGALGVVFWLAVAYGTGLTSLLSISLEDILRTITYSAFMIGGSVLFSIFWVSTSGMDSSTVAEQIQSIGMQIPGYRRDERVIESVLKKYIPYLAVLGGAAVGFLAVYADLTSAIGSGTGILLSTMIIYQLYEQIGMQHMEDMNPAVRRFFGEK